MKKNKRGIRPQIIRWLSGALLAVTLLALSACGAQPGTKKLRIVTTTFPLYDWARNVVGDEADVELSFLQDTGVDLHSYQPTAEDMVKIASCDLFIYVGGESDGWVADALKNSKNENRKALNLMEILGEKALAEEEKEGMQAEDHEDHDAAHEHGEEERDEHVWLSLKNASLFMGKIAEALAELAPEKKETFLSNAAAYQAKLDALRKEYEAAAAAAQTKTLLFGDRFPFLYLTKELGLDYKVGKFPFTASGKAAAAGERDGFVKLIVDEATDQVLGAHLVGANVSEMVGGIVVARNLGVTAKDIIKSVFPHPTMSEAILEAAEAAHNEAIHI